MHLLYNAINITCNLFIKFNKNIFDYTNIIFNSGNNNTLSCIDNNNIYISPIIISTNYDLILSYCSV